MVFLTHVIFVILAGLDESKKAEVESLALTKGKSFKIHIISSILFLVEGY